MLGVVGYVEVVDRISPAPAVTTAARAESALSFRTVAVGANPPGRSVRLLGNGARGVDVAAVDYYPVVAILSAHQTVGTEAVGVHGGFEGVAGIECAVSVVVKPELDSDAWFDGIGGVSYSFHSREQVACGIHEDPTRNRNTSKCRRN